MGTIHIANAKGEQRQMSEAEAAALQAQGAFEQGSLYWRDGMETWRPVDEYLPSVPDAIAPVADTVAPVRSDTPGSAYRFAIDPSALTGFVTSMLWACLGFEAISLLSDVAQLRMLGSDFTEEQANINDARQQLIALGYLVVFLVTSVGFLRWKHRAYRNCQGFGAVGMRFSPGWAVGYYFVPFINLVRPYQAMKEIWQVSHAPDQWPQQPVPPLLGIWWALWLLSGVLGQMSLRLPTDSVEGLRTSTLLSIGTGGVGIVLCIVAIKLVTGIAMAQARLVGED